MERTQSKMYSLACSNRFISVTQDNFIRLDLGMWCAQCTSYIHNFNFWVGKIFTTKLVLLRLGFHYNFHFVQFNALRSGIDLFIPANMCSTLYELHIIIVSFYSMYLLTSVSHYLSLMMLCLNCIHTNEIHIEMSHSC